MVNAFGFYIYVEAGLEMNLRCTALFKAYECIKKIHESSPCINTAFTCSRIALELGKQEEAIQFIQEIEKGDLVFKKDTFFLPPLETLDGIDGDLNLKNTILETLCSIICYSSYFARDTIKKLVQELGESEALTSLVMKQRTMC